MPIADLRESFKDRSGDINLSNKEIDAFLNTGIKLLDRITEFTHAPAKFFQKIPSGTAQVTFSSFCRVLSEVWLIDASTGRTELEKIVDAELRATYANIASIVPGKPLYYSNTTLRDFPQAFNPADPALAIYAKYIDTVDNEFNLRGLTIMPTSDKEYLIELVGKFNSPLLSTTVLDNWWTVNQDELVIQSGLYFYELYLRNTEGAKEYLNAIRTMTTEISNDIYEEDYANPVVMKG